MGVQDSAALAVSEWIALHCADKHRGGRVAPRWRHSLREIVQRIQEMPFWQPPSPAANPESRPGCLSQPLRGSNKKGTVRPSKKTRGGWHALSGAKGVADRFPRPSLRSERATLCLFLLEALAV